jgi:hypothetical protein
MKKFISTCLTIVLITLGVPAKTYAATDGCPDTWTIDLNQYPNQELLAAKQKNGINMIITESSRIINFNGELGEVSGPNDLIQSGGMDSLIFYYLYSKSLVEIASKIEIKNCPTKTFIFKTNWRPEIIFNSSTSESWANSNPQAFKDFKQQENFTNLLIERVKDTQNMIDKHLIRIQKYPNTQSQPLQARVLEQTTLNLGTTGIQLSVYAITPDCIKPGKRPLGNLFIFGKTCQFAFGASRSGDLRNITLFEPFTLDLTSKITTISCIKGKTTKKVSGTNPKCPKGYKVKV